jgi:phosphate starvation-inducible membrane PsiE
MKTNTLIYFLSIIIIAISTYFVVCYYQSTRMMLISGILFMLGISLYIIAYFTKNISTPKK